MCGTVCQHTAALNCETNAEVSGLKTQDVITLLTLQRVAIRPAGLQSGESLVSLAPLNQSASFQLSQKLVATPASRPLAPAEKNHGSCCKIDGKLLLLKQF